jgi:hypothetical protein
MSRRSCASKNPYSPSESPGATQVRDDVDITAGYPEVGGACLDEPHGSAEVLYLARVRGRSDQRGEPSVGIGPVDVGHECGPVAHGDRDVVVVPHVEFRLAEVAVVPSGGLRAVELPGHSFTLR